MALCIEIPQGEWSEVLKFEYPPNPKSVLEKLHVRGRNSIVPAEEVMAKHSAIDQVNRAFKKLGLPFRLRIVQAGYPNYSAFPSGFLVRLVKNSLVPVRYRGPNARST